MKKLTAIVLVLILISGCASVEKKYGQAEKFHALAVKSFADVEEILTTVIIEDRKLNQSEITRLTLIRERILNSYEQLKATVHADQIQDARRAISLITALIEILK